MWLLWQLLLRERGVHISAVYCSLQHCGEGGRCWGCSHGAQGVLCQQVLSGRPPRGELLLLHLCLCIARPAWLHGPGCLMACCP